MSNQLQTIALDEWRITFVMTAGQTRRAFTMTIPATDEKGALLGAHQIASGINESSGHVWKAGDEFTAELVTR